MTRLVAMLIVVGSLTATAEAQVLTLGTGGAEGSPSYVLLSKMYDAIAAKMANGVRFRLRTERSAERRLTQVNEGNLDGDAAETLALIAQYPNVVPVNASLGNTPFFAYGRAPLRAKVNGLESLYSLRVVSQLGNSVAKELLEGKMKDGGSISWVPSIFPEGYRMLLLGRGDVILESAATGEAVAQSPEFAGKIVRLDDRPLASVPIYLGLHKRHAKLIPALAAAIKALSADGTFEALSTAR